MENLLEERAVPRNALLVIFDIDECIIANALIQPGLTVGSRQHRGGGFRKAGDLWVEIGGAVWAGVEGVGILRLRLAVRMTRV